jgi:hypothetical protein
MLDSIVMADKPDIIEKLHGLSSTINLLSSSTTGRYGGKSGAPDLIMSSGFSLITCGVNLGIPSRMHALRI